MSVVASRKFSNRTVEFFELDALEASAQAITLSSTPTNPGNVVLDAPNGPIQINGFDFEVTGAVVSWAGKALETILEAGDKLIIIYD